MILSSRQHPLIKLARSLHTSKGRRETGLFLIEGRNAVGAALETHWPLRDVMTTPDEIELSGRAEGLGLPVQHMTSELLNYASEAQNAPSIMAIGEIPAHRGADFAGLTLVLDSVADPGNVGTLWRAADAAGATGVLSLGGADPFSPKVVRSAAGSSFYLPPAGSSNYAPEQFIEALKTQSVPIITARAHGGADCTQFEWPARLALVLGHETRGISPVWEEAADFGVTIPVWGRAESLNVAMAGVVLLYSWAQFQARNSMSS